MFGCAIVFDDGVVRNQRPCCHAQRLCLEGRRDDEEGATEQQQTSLFSTPSM